MSGNRREILKKKPECVTELSVEKTFIKQVWSGHVTYLWKYSPIQYMYVITCYMNTINNVKYTGMRKWRMIYINRRRNRIIYASFEYGITNNNVQLARQRTCTSSQYLSVTNISCQSLHCLESYKFTQSGKEDYKNIVPNIMFYTQRISHINPTEKK